MRAAGPYRSRRKARAAASSTGATYRQMYPLVRVDKLHPENGPEKMTVCRFVPPGHDAELTVRHTLLIDYHGVISDGERLPGEWQRLLGEFFIPRFGHSPREWAAANGAALARSIERQQAARGDAVAEEFRRSGVRRRRRATSRAH